MRCAGILWLTVMAVMFVFSGVAAACPVCESPVGEEVRAGIRRDFGLTMAQLSAPFLVLGAGLIIYHRYPSN